MTNTFKPLNFRIVRHVTRTRILTIEDALQFGKLKAGMVEYQKGQGAQAEVAHYLDADVAALLFHDILQGPPVVQWQGWQDYKGTRLEGGQVQARVFSFQVVEADNPVKLAIWNGPGEETPTGAVKPLKGATDKGASVAVLLSWPDARKIALQVLTHLQAWAAATYYQRVAEGTWKPPQKQPDTVRVSRETGEIIEEAQP